MSIKELTDEQVLENFLLDIDCLDELLPKDTNKIDFKFKRLKRFTFDIDFENVSKEEIKSKFLDSVDEVLLWEEKLLEKIQKKQYEY